METYGHTVAHMDACGHTLTHRYTYGHIMYAQVHRVHGYTQACKYRHRNTHDGHTGHTWVHRDMQEHTEVAN